MWLPPKHLRGLLNVMDVTLSPWQESVLFPPKSVKEMGILAGNQAGKSFVLSLEALATVLVPNTYTGIIVPILALARKQIFRYLKIFFRRYFKMFSYTIKDNRAELSLTVDHGIRGESKIEVLSFMKEDYLEDIVADLIILDELASASAHNIDWIETNLRTRLLTKKGKFIWITTNKGNKPYLREFTAKFRDYAKQGIVKRIGERGSLMINRDTMFIEKVSTYDNKVLDKDEIDRVKSHLSERAIRERLMGEDVSYAGGLVWPSFSREKNVKEIPYDRDWEMIWAIDLGFEDDSVFLLGGINPRNHIHIFDGFRVQHKTAIQLAPTMTSILTRYGIDKRTIQGFSDWNAQVYQEFNEPVEPFNFRCKAAIKPDLLDSVNHLDSLFSFGLLTISPKLEWLVSSIEKYEYDGKGKIEHRYSHGPDTCRYLVFALFDYFDFNVDDLLLPDIKVNEGLSFGNTDINFGSLLNVSKINYNW